MKKFIKFTAAIMLLLGSANAQSLITTSSNHICVGDSVVLTFSATNDTIIYSSITSTTTSIDTLVVDTCSSATVVLYPTTTTTYSILSPPFSFAMVVVSDNPSFHLTYEHVGCDLFDVSVDTLIGSSPFHFIWNNGVISDFASFNGGDTALLTVTDANGCIITDSMIFPMDTQVVIDSVITSPQTCNQGFASVFATGGQIEYLWLFDSTSVQNRTDLNSGFYTVRAINNYGCYADTTIYVDMVQNPQIIIPYINNRIDCYGDSINITSFAINGIAPYSYQWNIGDTMPDIRVPAGNYSVIVTDANNCKDTTFLVVQQPAELVATVTISQLRCEETDLTAIAVGGTTPYSYRWNTGDSTSTINVSSGVFTVNIMDANGCETSVSQIPVVSQSIQAHINASSNNVLVGTPVILAANQADEYIWSTGDTVQNITVYPTTTTNYTLWVRRGPCVDVTSLLIKVIESTDPDNPSDPDDPNVPTDPLQLNFELGDLHHVCIEHEPIFLQDYVNVDLSHGGQVVFVGNGVQDGIFYPHSIGSGTYLITASYTDPITHLHYYGEQSITVHPSTTIDFRLLESVVSFYSGRFPLTGGLPTGGTYSGPGVVEENGVFYFDPTIAGIGTHLLTYSYVNMWGCYSEIQKAILVTSQTGIEDEILNDISVYPNPVNTTLNIKLNKNISEVLLLDKIGRVIEQRQVAGESNIQFNMRDYSNGIYLVRFVSQDGQITTKKVIKQ